MEKKRKMTKRNICLVLGVILTFAVGIVKSADVFGEEINNSFSEQKEIESNLREGIVMVHYRMILTQGLFKFLLPFSKIAMSYGVVVSDEGYVLSILPAEYSTKDEVISTIKGTKYKTKVIAKDRQTGATLLKAESGNALTKLILGDITKLSVGKDVFIANPAGEIMIVDHPTNPDYGVLVPNPDYGNVLIYKGKVVKPVSEEEGGKMKIVLSSLPVLHPTYGELLMNEDGKAIALIDHVIEDSNSYVVIPINTILNRFKNRFKVNP